MHQTISPYVLPLLESSFQLVALNLVCNEHNITEDELLGKGNYQNERAQKHVVDARVQYAYLLRKYTALGNPAIGSKFGKNAFYASFLLQSIKPKSETYKFARSLKDVDKRAKSYAEIQSKIPVKEKDTNTYVKDNIPCAMRVIRVICNYFDVTVDELRGRSRKEEFAWPRHICFYLLCSHNAVKQARAGRFFGGRDHATANHSIKTVRNEYETNKAFKQTLIAIKSKIGYKHPEQLA